MSETDVQCKIRRLAALKGQRQLHESVWLDCYAYTHPIRASGFSGAPITAQDAQRRKSLLCDNTATDSARILASGLMSGLTPPNSRWFQLDVGQESDEERRWLDDAAQVVFENIHAGNFDAAAFECCTDVVDAGWFVLYAEMADEGGYAFEQWPLAQCYLSASKSGGVVDTIYREFELTVEQTVNLYGIDRVSPKTRELYQAEKFEDLVQVLHAIEPRSIYLVGGKMANNMPFASCHVETKGNVTLRESGYEEFPCAAPRWMLIPGSAYGTGPVSDCLADIRTLNEIKRMELAALDLAIAGMWIATDDGVLNPRTVTVGARKIIVANSIDSMKELKSGSDFQVSFTAEERLQAAIRKALLADQLQPQQGPAMTATEVNQRVALIRQLLGPIYGRLQAEYLQPVVERCFGIAYRAGVLGVAPTSLAGRAFHVKYVSPLARAQKLEEVNAIDQFVAGVLQIAPVDPSVMDTIDMDAAMKHRGESLGVPFAILPSVDDIAAKRRARADAQQKQAQREAAMQTQQVAGEAVVKKVVGG